VPISEALSLYNYVVIACPSSFDIWDYCLVLSHCPCLPSPLALVKGYHKVVRGFKVSFSINNFIPRKSFCSLSVSWLPLLKWHLGGRFFIWIPIGLVPISISSLLPEELHGCFTGGPSVIFIATRAWFSHILTRWVMLMESRKPHRKIIVTLKQLLNSFFGTGESSCCYGSEYENVFWVVAPCSLVEIDNGASKHVWNVGQFLPDYTAQYP
jgi:hypothetical protein